MTTLVVLQPSYLPWLGYFDQIDRADVFVYLDDVQFDRNGWRNRNRIKGPAGPLWLSVPCLLGGRGMPPIAAVEIDRRQPWARKHMATLEQLYARAPFAATYLPQLREVLCRDWRLLVDVDMAVIGLLCGWLGITARFERSSALGIGGERSGRLLDLCRHFGADTYLSGAAARSYLDTGLFEAAGIRVEWQDYHHPTYPQRHGAFVSHLSVLDLILNAGPASPDILRNGCS